MAIYTFSTKETKPLDKKSIEAIKLYCQKNNINFSGLVVKILRDWEKENVREQKPSSS